MGVVTYLVILLVLVLVCVYTAKVAYRRGLNTIPEALKPKFGLKEALQLKPVLDKMGVVSPVMAVYTTKLVAMLGAVNNLASDVAAAVADRDRQVSGLQRSIAANEAAIKGGSGGHYCEWEHHRGGNGGKGRRHRFGQDVRSLGPSGPDRPGATRAGSFKFFFD